MWDGGTLKARAALQAMSPRPTSQAGARTITPIKEGSRKDRSRWPEASNWLVKEVAIFRRVLTPRIKSIDLPPGTADTEGEQPSAGPPS